MKIELAGSYGYRRMIRSSIPSILMMLMTSVYGIVDGLFVSNFAGTTAFAAINLVWPAIMMLGAFGLMFGTGGSALVAMIIGQGDRDRANRAFTMIVRSMLIIGLVVTVLFFVLARPIVILLGAEGDMIGLCVLYGRILVLVMPLFVHVPDGVPLVLYDGRNPPVGHQTHGHLRHHKHRARRTPDRCSGMGCDRRGNCIGRRYGGGRIVPAFLLHLKET